jgi:hypothetical protein
MVAAELGGGLDELEAAVAATSLCCLFRAPASASLSSSVATMLDLVTTAAATGAAAATAGLAATGAGASSSSSPNRDQRFGFTAVENAIVVAAGSSSNK